MSLSAELIQVAAVAAATVEDLEYGSANIAELEEAEHGGHFIDYANNQVDVVLEMIGRERERQNDMWGGQHHDPAVWLAILMEEVGEVAEHVQHTAKSPYLTDLVDQIIDLGKEAKALLESGLSLDVGDLIETQEKAVKENKRRYWEQKVEELLDGVGVD